jgi:hypothetical protein
MCVKNEKEQRVRFPRTAINLITSIKHALCPFIDNARKKNKKLETVLLGYTL